MRYPESWSALSVTLAHDWLTGMRGGERVLEWLARGFPSAPICTLFHRPAAVSDTINAHPIHTSRLQRVPGIFQHYRWLLPVFPSAVRAMRAPPGDVLISTSHCVAKALPHPPAMRHLCYCFTPMRYAWTFPDEYLGARSLKRRAAAPILARLRDWDRRTAEGVDRFVTLSRHVQDRIRRHYGREAEVVYPPVDVDYFTPAATPAAGDYDLIVSALVPYKRVDLAVRAYARLGWPLKIVGAGTGFTALRALAGPQTEFLGWRSDAEIRELYRGCRLLVFPGEEDFGIVPVEAQACGKPVVAFGRGGATESVAEGISGVFFPEQTEAALLAAVETAAGRTWDAAAIRRQAERFSPQAFIDGLDRALQALLAGGAA
jgi:glycosyltransferase involved in cell wall biosynthesis